MFPVVFQVLGMLGVIFLLLSAPMEGILFPPVKILMSTYGIMRDGMNL